MSEYKTILRPATMLIADRLAEPNAGKCERVLNIGLFFDGTDNSPCHFETGSLRSPKPVKHASASLAVKARTLLTALLLGVMAAGCNKSSSEDLVPDKDMVAIPVGVVVHYGAGIGIPSISINSFQVSNFLGWGGGGGSHCCVLPPANLKYPGPEYPGGPAPPYEPLPDEAPRREAPKKANRKPISGSQDERIQNHSSTGEDADRGSIGRTERREVRASSQHRPSLWWHGKQHLPRRDCVLAQSQALA